MRYQQLILEKAKIDRRIRAFRVVRIHQAFVTRKEAIALHRDIDEMETLISSVFYDESKLDFILDHIEIQLDLDLEDL